MATDAVQTAETRGRPRIRDNDDILRAALHAFAEHGYDGMSLRTLNAEMGLSRGTINQRFGSKEQLWYAAVDHEFRHLIDDLNAELQQRTVPDDDLSRLREGIRAFLIASVRRPELVRLMNQEGLHSTSRLDYIMTSFTLPTLTPVMAGPEPARRRRRGPTRACPNFAVPHRPRSRRAVHPRPTLGSIRPR